MFCQIMWQKLYLEVSTEKRIQIAEVENICEKNITYNNVVKFRTIKEAMPWGKLLNGGRDYRSIKLGNDV